MKLSSARIVQTLDQFQAQAIPESHPVVPQLNRMFGEHTFFLNEGGLHIVEPEETANDGKQTAKVVNLAHWKDETRSSLTPHKPEPTDVLVVLGLGDGEDESGLPPLDDPNLQ